MADPSDAKNHAKPRTRARKAKPKRSVKPRNAPAAALADARYRNRVVESPKAYNRKTSSRPVEDQDT